MQIVIITNDDPDCPVSVSKLYEELRLTFLGLGYKQEDVAVTVDRLTE